MSKAHAPPASRTSKKLAAAIDRLGLADKIRSQRAIDIGASTGGFAEQLLKCGAKRVTAIDVGHDQFHPSLRGDPRVENLERTHFKTLALEIAPGPFDFFTVDVSFMAARTMLRGLAFRLRPGAEGIVLIKPQFELPRDQVKDVKVTDPNLRRSAVELVRDKATSLGFEILEAFDAAVAGEIGTEEILAHLRFKGRSDRLPALDEKRVSAPPPTKSPSEVPLSEKYFAIAAPGLGEAVTREVTKLEGVRDVEAVPGGVTFSGATEVLYRANLELRVASRVLVRIGEIETREFPKLRRMAAKLPWEYYVGADMPVEVSASASSCRLYHTGALAENLSAAIDDRLGRKALPPEPEDSTRPTLKVLLRGERDKFTVSVDSSGELLHKRGWRTELVQAPMRETLAAALLTLSEWDPATTLVDPMCGSGTVPIEACSLSMRVAPGIARSFAFEKWPRFDSAKWSAIRARSDGERKQAPAGLILGADGSARAITVAKNNAERAGLSSHLQFVHRSLRDLAPPTETGLLIANPPYGERLGSGEGVKLIYRELGSLLKGRFERFRAAILVPEKQIRLATPLGHTSNRFKLQNGGIRLQLWCLPPFRA